MREVTLDDLSQVLGRGATVVDVREPGEYAEGYVPGAVHIPMGPLPARVKGGTTAWARADAPSRKAEQP